MLPLFDPLRQISLISTAFRLFLACLCGAVIGLERSAKNRPAGFRTHMLVCLGAAISTMTGIYMFTERHLLMDISRMGAQVITGLGFIGAGTIIVTKKNTVKGLTTAAGLWTCGIIGLAIGSGFYEGGILATAFVLFIETGFGFLGKFRRPPEFRILVHYEKKQALDQVMRFCKDNRIVINNLRIRSDTGGESENASLYSAEIALHPTKNVDRTLLLDRIVNMAGIDDAEEI